MQVGPAAHCHGTLPLPWHIAMAHCHGTLPLPWPIAIAMAHCHCHGTLPWHTLFCRWAGAAKIASRLTAPLARRQFGQCDVTAAWAAAVNAPGASLLHICCTAHGAPCCCYPSGFARAACSAGCPFRSVSHPAVQHVLRDHCHSTPCTGSCVYRQPSPGTPRLSRTVHRQRGWRGDGGVRGLAI